MSEKFNIGNQVVCVDASHSEGVLVAGEVYGVSDTTPSGAYVAVDDGECFWASERFKLYKSLEDAYDNVQPQASPFNRHLEELPKEALDLPQPSQQAPVPSVTAAEFDKLAFTERLMHAFSIAMKSALEEVLKNP